MTKFLSARIASRPENAGSARDRNIPFARTFSASELHLLFAADGAALGRK